MSLFMQPKFVASSAANLLNSAHAHANKAATTAKRNAWYPAFADQGTWSQFG